MKLEEILVWNDVMTWLESATTVLPYKKLESSTSLNTKYGFVFNDDVYVVEFDYTKISNNAHVAVLTFYVATKEGQKEHGTLNKGKYAGPVFGTVVDIVKQENNNWDVLCYVGMGESRVGIYRYLFKKNSPGLFYYQHLMPNGMIFVVSKIEIPSQILSALTAWADRVIVSKD